MKEMPDSKEKLQWHPAFYAGLQIEFEAEADQLSFENEHQLGTKPKVIDILIIKKQENYRVQKNIGRIFKKHNIIEYKSPTDSLSINDFYRVCGYTCFYKADTLLENSILISELTITFVCSHYPRKLIQHLKETLNYDIHPIEAGIYYIENSILPIQFVITSRLSRKENLWLKSLTNQLAPTDEADHLVSEYRKHKDNTLYQSVMDIIIRANIEKFQEVKKHMCEALKELMKDEYDAMYQYFESERLEIENQKMEVENQKQEVENQKLEVENQKQEVENQKLDIFNKGISEGQERTLISLILRKLKFNKSLEIIACELDENPDSIKRFYDIAKAHPEYGTDSICQCLHPTI